MERGEIKHLNKDENLRLALREHARNLYLLGQSYNQIAASLNTNKSTISGWCHDLTADRLDQRKQEAAHIREEKKRQKDEEREARRLEKKSLPKKERAVGIKKEPKPKKERVPREKKVKYDECVVCEALFVRNKARRQTCSDDCQRTLTGLLRKYRSRLA